MATVWITIGHGISAVKIDGQEIQDVVSIGFNAGADEKSEVTLVLAPNLVVITGEVDEAATVQLVGEAGPCKICGRDATGPRVQPANALLCHECLRSVVIP